VVNPGADDEYTQKLLSVLATAPERFWLVDELAVRTGADPADVEAVVAWFERVGWAQEFQRLPGDEPGRMRRNHVRLTELGEWKAKRLPKAPKQRGVVGTFLWEGTDATKAAWDARGSFPRARRSRSRAHRGERSQDGAAEWSMVDEYSEPLVTVVRRDGWLAAYEILQWRRRARAQRQARERAERQGWQPRS